MRVSHTSVLRLLVPSSPRRGRFAPLNRPLIFPSHRLSAM
jgi:hypothetical protein